MPLANERLTGMRTLVVEDEYLIALDIEQELRSLHCEVVGPFSTAAAALDAILHEDRLDGALLDLNLQGKTVQPLADKLAGRDVPFILVTGYTKRQSEAPVLRDARWLPKPFRSDALAAAMAETFVRRSP